MKNLTYIPFVISLLFSCSDNGGEKEISLEYPQHWKLIKMTGNIPNSVTTGNKMEWQEVYVFNADGTFVKTQKRNNLLFEGTGTYTHISIADEEQLSLMYESGEELAGDCFVGNSESLRLLDNKLVSTWQMCDGPGLEYELCLNCTLQ